MNEKREKVFIAVLNYAQKHGFEGDYATSEALYQNDDMQIEGLELVGELLDILEEK